MIKAFSTTNHQHPPGIYCSNTNYKHGIMAEKWNNHIEFYYLSPSLTGPLRICSHGQMTQNHLGSWMAGCAHGCCSTYVSPADPSGNGWSGNRSTEAVAHVPQPAHRETQIQSKVKQQYDN